MEWIIGISIFSVILVVLSFCLKLVAQDLEIKAEQIKKEQDQKGNSE